MDLAKPPAEEQRRRAVATSALLRVAVSDVGVFFDRERALCAGASATSMAAVRRGSNLHGGGAVCPGPLRWTTLEVLHDVASLGGGFLDRRRASHGIIDNSFCGYDVSPKAFDTVVVDVGGWGGGTGV
jgi:hypothetical protein